MAMQIIDIAPIHAPLLLPIIGKMTVGKMSAARIPVTITVATWLNTESTPRCVESRVESGTIMLWLML